MAKLFIVQDLETKESFFWSLSNILKEINRDRSEKWTDYNKSDWREGWFEWCEGDYLRLIKVIYGVDEKEIFALKCDCGCTTD